MKNYLNNYKNKVYVKQNEQIMEGRKYNVYLDDVWRWEGSFYKGIMNDKPQKFLLVC